jgi:hypothetical protein
MQLRGVSNCKACSSSSSKMECLRMLWGVAGLLHITLNNVLLHTQFGRGRQTWVRVIGWRAHLDRTVSFITSTSVATPGMPAELQAAWTHQHHLVIGGLCDAEHAVPSKAVLPQRTQLPKLREAHGHASPA